MARQVKYTFLEKDNARGARLAILLSVISLAVMPLLFLLSFFGIGKGHTVLGGIGLAAGLLAIYSFVLGLRALAKRDSHIRIAAAATILSGIVSIAWVAVFILGAA